MSLTIEGKDQIVEEVRRRILPLREDDVSLGAKSLLTYFYPLVSGSGEIQTHHNTVIRRAIMPVGSNTSGWAEFYYPHNTTISSIVYVYTQNLNSNASFNVSFEFWDFINNDTISSTSDDTSGIVTITPFIAQEGVFLHTIPLTGYDALVSDRLIACNITRRAGDASSADMGGVGIIVTFEKA